MIILIGFLYFFAGVISGVALMSLMVISGGGGYGPDKED